MKNWLSRLDRNLFSILKTIARKADEQGIPVFVVGGFVRDLILNRPNLDLDIVAETDAVAFAQRLAKDQDASLIVFKQFGTATMIFPQGLRVDLATARKERYAQSGALPLVEPGSIHEDLFRRDFTINALALRINKDRLGELVDDFKGLDDLKQKKIRILHDQSFQDDPTRILRAVRFEQRFNFQIERHSFKLLKSALDQGLVRHVKPERYFEEFKKILSEESPAKSIQRLYPLGGLDFLGIVLKDMSGTLRLMKKLEGIQTDFSQISAPQRTIHPHTRQGVGVQYWLVYFMALVAGAPFLKLKKILKKFNFKRSDQDKILSCRELPRVLQVLKRKALRPSQVFAALKPLNYETILFLKAKASESIVADRIDRFLKEYDFVKLTIDGDVLKTLGIPPGKGLGEILKTLLYAKVDGLIKTREDELKKAEQLIQHNRGTLS